MPRIRSIKPDFFMHEGLAELSPLHRLLFIGLWTQADRAGRLEDRPKRLKASLLPWEDCDLDALLEDLHVAGFILRYELEGAGYIQIPSFERHQKPHVKEAVSTIPAPPDNPSRASREKAVLAREGFSAIPASTPASRVVMGVVSGSGSGGGEPEPGKEPAPPPEGRASPVGGVPTTPEMQRQIADRRAEPRVPAAVEYQRPTTPEEAWGGEDFFAWAQVKRQEAGCLGEPLPRGVSTWYSAALMALGGDVEALQDAFYAFGDDPHWQQAAPPLPFRAFMSQWARYVPQGVAHAGA